MFKKLRNRLIVANLSILTILLIAIFGSLYYSTYQDVNNRIYFELEKVLAPYNPNSQLNPIEGGPVQSVSFLIEIQDNEIVDTLSRFNLPEDYYEDVYELVDNTEGSIDIDNQYWDYRSIEVSDSTIYAFVNTTNDRELLTSTLTSYILIFAGSFLVVAIISYFMTNKSIKPVKESFDKQKRFISDASHELKTPLTVINANVDVLLSQNTNKKDKKWLEYIQREVLRMNKLTHNLLYLATVSNEDKNFIKSEVNISSEVESVLLGIEALAYEKEINLEYNIAPNLTVLYNQEQLTQAIMILVDNAIKYTNKKGTISVDLKASNNNVYLTIRNTGDGIKESDIPRLFDRFYKVDESRQSGSDSYGLGLSILKAICDYHNTKINITSKENEHTEFELKFQIK